MQFKYECRKIRLSQIFKDKTTYCITTQKDGDDLTVSMNSLGLLHPPILKPINASEFMIIAGFRRISAACALRWQEIPAHVIPVDTDNLTCSLLAIASNTLERSLNLIELSKAFGLLSRDIRHQDEIKQYAKILNLPYNPGYYQKLMALGRLPQTIQEGIIHESIALPCALLLEKMKIQDAIALSDLLRKLRLSLNKQRELIVLSDEIAIREDIAIEDVLASRKINDIISDSDLDHAQKARMIRDYLKSRRFPHLTRGQDQFDEFTVSLALGPNLKLIPPPGFEGNTYMLTVSFRNTDELSTLHSSISGLLRNSKFLTYFNER